LIGLVNPAPQNRTPSVWRRFGHEGWFIWRLGWGQVLRRWWQFLLIVGVGMILVFADRAGFENQLLQNIRQPENETLTRFAKFLSSFGDVIWALLLAIILAGYGLAFGAPRWRQVGWACLIAVLASTIIVNLFRPTLGRARPHTGLPGEFHGPTLNSKFFGFPSGHASSAFAPAVAVAVAAPVVGVPCLIFASSVSWSRMQLNRHRPLDVMTGAALGTLIGLCFGSVVEGARSKLKGKNSKIQTPKSK
jgi:membrane-associated phospholipid phosphatase